MTGLDRLSEMKFIKVWSILCGQETFLQEKEMGFFERRRWFSDWLPLSSAFITYWIREAAAWPQAGYLADSCLPSQTACRVNSSLFLDRYLKSPLAYILTHTLITRWNKETTQFLKRTWVVIDSIDAKTCFDTITSLITATKILTGSWSETSSLPTKHLYSLLRGRHYLLQKGLEKAFVFVGGYRCWIENIEKYV